MGCSWVWGLEGTAAKWNLYEACWIETCDVALCVSSAVPSSGPAAAANDEGESRLCKGERARARRGSTKRARVEALEGVQKDVRRTVSVMQYNILASCAQCLKLGECSKQGASVTVEVPGQEHTALVSLWCGHQPRGETLLGPCLVPSACPALANRSGRGSSPASTNEALMARGSPGKDPFGVRRVALLATMA